ncbi:MAG TPA: BlaI/MecI/CopY family transcriptional regulator [Gemmatimonadaceae bacterium]|nr:BlaI/MecI/CopY family transcriptional regulator [Gemmatimonadaceae bacterium]
MPDPLAHKLSRRERQIMDLLFRQGAATAAEVRDGIPDAPSYSAVRALLRTLEEKGFVTHREDGPRYVYAPTVARDAARRSALRHLVQTFFDGSTTQAMAALMDLSDRTLSREELDRLARLVERSKEEGR